MAKREEYQKCKECNTEMKPIRFRGKINWECAVHGIYNKLGKKIISY